MRDKTLTADLVTIYQVAALLGVSVSTVYRWDELGMIPAPIEFGGRHRWRLSELKKWAKADFPPRPSTTKRRGAKAEA